MLYHYTDFAAFDGIIRCAELRLNNVLNMNDTSEMRFFMRSIHKAVMENISDNPDVSRETAAAYNTRFLEELQKEFHYSAYAACFSRYRDDASQWERYGHLGQGVCIAFHQELLKNLLGEAISLQDVFYMDDIRGHELVDAFCRLICTSGALEDTEAEFVRLMNQAWVQSAAFKHPSFVNENEVRLVVSPFIIGEFAVEPKYHVSRERIKKYYPLDLNRMCGRADIHFSDLIGEIIIGPTSSQSLAILQDYLEDNGLHALANRITMSSCPLRKAGL